MKHNNFSRDLTIILILVLAITLAACTNTNSTFLPTQPPMDTLNPTNTSQPTHNPTITPTMTPTDTPTLTLTSTPTVTPTVTATKPPMVFQTPVTGKMYYEWLKYYQIDAFAVFAGNVVLCDYDYICPGETGEIFKLGQWGPNNWRSQFVYVGQAPLDIDKKSDITILFPGDAGFKDIVLLFNSLAVDYIAGILPDGREVPFNYTYDSQGKLVPGSNFMETWDKGGDLSPVFSQSHTLEKIIACGIAGAAPDGNYSRIGIGGILFRMPKVTYDQLKANPELWGTRGMNVYELIGIRVVYAFPSNINIRYFCGTNF